MVDNPGEDKVYISPQQLLEDSYRLGKQILESGYNPNFLVGLWRGGTPVGIAVQEYLAYQGLKNDHISIRTSRDGPNGAIAKTRVHGLEYLISHSNAENRLLLVDDVYDTGLTIQAVIEVLTRKMRRNLPQIHVATIYYKPTKNVTPRKPDFYLYETDKWLVFPHELKDLNEEEILAGKGQVIYELLKRTDQPPQPPTSHHAPHSL
jgi:hypoxanthine phosphoribosyltransferase